MTRVQMTQAVAADYADAMLVARRAKNTLVLLLALVLLVQLGVFFAVRFVLAVKIRPDVAPATPESLVAPTPSPSDSSSTSAATTTRPAESNSVKISWPSAIQYVLACTGFLGVLLSMVLAAVMWVIVMIMLVGRLVGVAHVMRAFCWSILFIVLLFPWQKLLNTPGHLAGTSISVQTGGTALADETPDPRIPGVLYTFTELRRDYDFSRGLSSYSILKWSRYVGFPALALLILLTIQGRSRRGLRFALGEAEIPMDAHRV